MPGADLVAVVGNVAAGPLAANRATPDFPRVGPLCVAELRDQSGCSHDYDFWQDKDSIEEAFWQVHSNAVQYWDRVLSLVDSLVAATSGKPREILYRKVAEDEGADDDARNDGEGVDEQGKEEDNNEKHDEAVLMGPEHEHEAQHQRVQDERMSRTGTTQRKSSANNRRPAKRQKRSPV